MVLIPPSVSASFQEWKGWNFRSDSYYKSGICTRLSIGLEDPDFLIRDIEQALQIPLWDLYEKVKGGFYET